MKPSTISLHAVSFSARGDTRSTRQQRSRSTRLISPPSTTRKAVAEIAHSAGAELSVDPTIGTPLELNPIALGGFRRAFADQVRLRAWRCLALGEPRGPGSPSAVPPGQRAPRRRISRLAFDGWFGALARLAAAPTAQSRVRMADAVKVVSYAVSLGKTRSLLVCALRFRCRRAAYSARPPATRSIWSWTERHEWGVACALMLYGLVD